MQTFNFRYFDRKQSQLIVLYFVVTAALAGLFFALAPDHLVSSKLTWLVILSFWVSGMFYLQTHLKKSGTAQLSDTELQLTLNNQLQTIALTQITKCLCTTLRGRDSLTLLLADDSYIGITEAKINSNVIASLSQAITTQLENLK